MAKSNPEVFQGKPVIEFQEESDRRRFLTTAAKVGVGGALVFAGVACSDDGGNGGGKAAGGSTPTEKDKPSDGGADVPSGDIEILAYALTLELLEADFYKQGTEGGALSGRELELAQAIGAHETAHVEALTATIKDVGGEVPPTPKFKYPPGTFDDRDAFLETALTFEELGVTAYHGQVGNIQTPDLLAAAASIAGVESRHAAVLANRISGKKPFPAPLEAAQDMDAVLEAAKPFIAS